MVGDHAMIKLMRQRVYRCLQVKHILRNGTIKGRPPLLIVTFLVVGLCLSLPSCAGQNDYKASPEQRAPIISSRSQQDPLFFIEGQLCQHLREIFQDSKGNLWLGTNVYDLLLFDGDSLQSITKKDGFSGGRVTAIAEDSQGNIWLATGLGLNKYDGKNFRVFTRQDGLPNAEIWSMLIDETGIIWIGHNEGLCRFDGQDFENIPIPWPIGVTPNPVFAERRITSITIDQSGHFWLGTDGYGLCKYDGETFTFLTTSDGLCDNSIYDLLLDRNANLWIGTFGGGLSKFDGEHFTNYTRDGVITGLEVTGLFEDDNGDIWFGVEHNGVYQYDGATFRHYSKAKVLNASILSIFKDREGRFWFGGWGGLFRFDGESFTSVTKAGPW